MNIEIDKLNFRKLKISDYREFQKLFYSCFQKKISLNFYKWRYFTDKFSFCYGVFYKKRLIANVGMVSFKLNNHSKDRVFSRHSSMVLKKYRSIGIFSKLLNRVKKKISKEVSIVVMWPNKNNFSNFGLSGKNVFENNFYLYKVNKKNYISKKTKNISIDKLIEYKKHINNNNCLYYKDFKFFKKRYLSYDKNKYFLNMLKIKKFNSFFIIKKNKDKFGESLVILDHFGSEKIYPDHLSCIKHEENKIVFFSRKKINKLNYNLIAKLKFKIGFLKKIKMNKNFFLRSKRVYPGDTDSFIDI